MFQASLPRSSMHSMLSVVDFSSSESEAQKDFWASLRFAPETHFWISFRLLTATNKNSVFMGVTLPTQTACARFFSQQSFRPFRQLYRIRGPVAFGAYEIMRHAVAGVASHGVKHFAVAAD
jgi:hypothetical protein